MMALLLLTCISTSGIPDPDKLEPEGSNLKVISRKGAKGAKKTFKPCF
jgi:hypothetical protein